MPIELLARRPVMPKRRDRDRPESEDEGGLSSLRLGGEAVQNAGGPLPRVLAVDQNPRFRGDVQRALAALGVRCDAAGTLAESRRALREVAYDLVIVDERQADGCGLDLVRELSGASEPVRCIVTSDREGFDGVIEAMRCGAMDYITKPYRPAEIAGRVVAAIATLRRLRASERRVRRLKRICRRLDSARRDMSRQVDSLCTDLVTAYQELADQVTHSAMANEFALLIRSELDVEALLRTTLEYLLARTGPTNAAVFLPTGTHDFNLGAYVNCDVPRETADVLLDHLADVIAPRFEHEEGIVRLTTAEEIGRRLGGDASWLNDSCLLVFSCRQEGECLAVVALFRDRSNPFPDDLLPQLEVIRDLFGGQLDRIIRVHHRHRPEQRWPGFDVDEDRGLAA